MNFGQLQTAVRDLLGEDSAGFYSAAMLKRWVNLAAKSVYNRIDQANQRYFMTTGTITLVASQELYNLPNTNAVLRVVLVERTDQSVPFNLKPKDVTVKNDFRRDNAANLESLEMVYFFAGNQIGFAPIPNAAATAAIKVWYIPPFTDLSADGDTLPAAWTENHHEIIVWEACCKMSRRPREDLIPWLTVRNQLREDLIAEVQDRQVQEPMTVEPPVDSY